MAPSGISTEEGGAKRWPRHTLETLEQAHKAIAVSAGGVAQAHIWRTIRLIIAHEYKTALPSAALSSAV